MNRIAMNIQCIALDMDRTTLNAESRLSDGNRKALLYAIDKGVHVVIASGRSYLTLPQDVTSLPGIEYAITSNGAEVYECKTGKCLKSSVIPPDDVVKILQLTSGETVAYEGFIRGEAFAGEEYIKDPVRFGATPVAVEYVKRTRKMVPDIRTFLLEHKQELCSMDIITRDDAIKLRLMDLLRREIPSIYMTSSISQLLEISSIECGKHNGLRFIADMLHIPMSETAAFGDGDNDVEMLQTAGIGIAVENASDAAKQAAAFVVAHHDRDGVAEGIYHLLP